MTTLGQLVETLGSTVVDTVAAPRGLDTEVKGVVIRDGHSLPDLRAGDVLLGVGVDSDEDASTILKVAGEADAAAVVLKKNGVSDSVDGWAREAGVALVQVPDGAAWAQIDYLIQSVLSHGRFSHEEEKLGGIPAGDLFALADAIAALIGAPVTIEDRMSRVLAFSADQQSADAERSETVLGRQVPDRYRQQLEDFGVFEALETQDTVFVESFEEGMLCRLVAPVRAGGELLGSIWAAVSKRPTAEQERALFDSAKLAVLHLLRHRAGSDVERNLQADLVATILDGGAAARESAARLGLTEGGFRVLAISPTGGSNAEATPNLRDAVAVHMARSGVAGTAAVLGGFVFAVMSCETRKHSDVRARNIARDLSASVDSGKVGGVLVGIGGHADSLSEIPRSRKEAEEAVRVLRAGMHKESAATIDDVRVQVLLTRFAEYAAEEKEMYAGKIQPLIDCDQEHGTAYVESLRAYFEEFGDINAASRRLHVHPNTLRYRLKKAQTLSDLRLDDHHERLALMLLLSVLLDI